jgi:hypothetical protein
MLRHAFADAEFGRYLVGDLSIANNLSTASSLTSNGLIDICTSSTYHELLRVCTEN